MARWEHETVLESAQARLDRSPDAMRIRRATEEHPFGTLKAGMGSTHFLSKTLDRVSTGMSLHVLAYNMKRMMNIIGTKPKKPGIEPGFHKNFLNVSRCIPDRRSVGSLLLNHFNFFGHIKTIILCVIGGPPGRRNLEHPDVIEGPE